MKKNLLLLSAFAGIIIMNSCASNQGEKTNYNDNAAATADSVKEQRKLDSLFNAANKNVEGATDSLKK